VKGLVTDENGAPLYDVDVTVLGQTEGVFSGVDGVFEITDPAVADNINLMFGKEGYASNWESTAVYGGVTSTVRVALKTRVTAVTFDATTDFSKSFGNNKVTIPANSLESRKVVDVAVCGEFPGLIENVVLDNCGESRTDPSKCYPMPDFWDDIDQGWTNASTHCRL